MKKIMILSAITSAILLSTGCGGGSSSSVVKKDENKTKNPPIAKPKLEPKPNIDKVEEQDLKIIRNNQSQEVEITFKPKGSNVVQYFIDVDNNTVSGSTDSSIIKGADYRVINYLNDPTKNMIMEVNSTDRTKWIKSSKKVTQYKNDGTIILSHEVIPSKYFSVYAERYDINSSSNEWIYKGDTQNSVMFDMKLVNSGNPQKFIGDHNLTMSVDSNNKEIGIKLLGNAYSNNTVIYIDSDESNTTGYDTGLWKNFGADYYLYNNKIFKRTNNGWSENKTYKSLKKDGVIKYSLKREDIDALGKSKIKLAVAVHNNTNLDTNISGSIPKVNGIYNNAKSEVSSYILNNSN